MAAKRKHPIPKMRRIYNDVKKVDEKYGSVRGGRNLNAPEKEAKKKELEALVYKYHLKSVGQMRCIARDYVRQIREKEERALYLEIKDERERALWRRVNTTPWRSCNG